MLLRNRMMAGLLLLMGIILPVGLTAQAGDRLHSQAAGKVVVARVNGRPITLAELMTRMRQIRATSYGSAKLTEEFGRRLKQEALDKMILEELAFQEAQRRGVVADPAKVDAFIAAARSQHRDEQHFLKYLEIMGYTPESFRRHAERMVMIQEVIDQDINRKIDEVPEEVARAYYDRNRAEFIQQEAVEVTDIVFFVDPASKEGRAQAAALRRRLVEQLDGDPGRLPEGDFYYVQPNLKLSKVKTPVLYEAARKLEPNAISDIINEDGTLHVVKLTGYRPYRETSFEDALPRIKQRLLARRRQEALRQWLDDLRAKAKVEILDVATQ